MRTVHVIVDVTYDTYTKREIDPTDSWDAGETGLTNINVDVRLAQNESERKYADEVRPAEDGTICVLVEHYGDGCTFGSSEYAEVKGVFTDEADAVLYAKTLNTDHGYFGWHEDFKYFTVKV